MAAHGFSLKSWILGKLGASWSNLAVSLNHVFLRIYVVKGQKYPNLGPKTAKIGPF